jgi:hypothetical protein
MGEPGRSRSRGFNRLRKANTFSSVSSSFYLSSATAVWIAPAIFSIGAILAAGLRSVRMPLSVARSCSIPDYRATRCSSSSAVIPMPYLRARRHRRCEGRVVILADHNREATLFRASQIVTQSPSDNTNITIEEVALLSRAWGTRPPSGRTNGGSYARQAPCSNKTRRRASSSLFRGTILGKRHHHAP